MVDLKDTLAKMLIDIIKQKGFSQSEAARRLGLSQPRISNLLGGNFYSLSVERMLRYLNTLGYDVQICVSENKRVSRRGRTEVKIKFD